MHNTVSVCYIMHCKALTFHCVVYYIIYGKALTFQLDAMCTVLCVCTIMYGALTSMSDSVVILSISSQ